MCCKEEDVAGRAIRRKGRNMPNTITVERAGAKQVARVGLDSTKLTIAPARKSGFDYISVALGERTPSVGFVEVYSTGVRVRLVSHTDRQRSVRFEYCIPVPPGSPGPTFPGPECPSKWPFPGWPIPSRPDVNDLLVVRVVGRGLKTRAASIVNSEQLMEFLDQVSSEAGRLIGSEAPKRFEGITVVNSTLARDARFRNDLKGALPQAGSPVTVFSKKDDKADEIGDVANAACGVAAAVGGPIAAGAACGFALGWAIGGLLWG